MGEPAINFLAGLCRIEMFSKATLREIQDRDDRHPLIHKARVGHGESHVYQGAVPERRVGELHSPEYHFLGRIGRDKREWLSRKIGNSRMPRAVLTKIEQDPLFGRQLVNASPGCVGLWRFDLRQPRRPQANARQRAGQRQPVSGEEPCGVLLLGFGFNNRGLVFKNQMSRFFLETVALCKLVRNGDIPVVREFVQIQ